MNTLTSVNNRANRDLTSQPRHAVLDIQQYPSRLNAVIGRVVEAEKNSYGESAYRTVDKHNLMKCIELRGKNEIPRITSPAQKRWQETQLIAGDVPNGYVHEVKDLETLLDFVSKLEWVHLHKSLAKGLELWVLRVPSQSHAYLPTGMNGVVRSSFVSFILDARYGLLRWRPGLFQEFQPSTVLTA